MLQSSIVIITHNNYMLKNGSIETEILTLMSQKNVCFEIIIIDNASEISDFSRLILFVQSLKVDYIRVFRNINNIASGRNLGVKNSKSDNIIFMDDDVLLIDENTLMRVLIRTHHNIYGYGAIRLWSYENDYEENKEKYDQELLMKVIPNFVRTTPDPNIRNKKNDRHLMRSYIGNFGFVNKTAFYKIGCWDEKYIGYGCEDDDISLRLYLEYGKPHILSDIEILHINHKISKMNYEELVLNEHTFNEKKRLLGIHAFHMGRLLYDEDGIIIE